jgi:hypothetical protein
MAFNLDNYEDVQSRVKRFQEAFPVGRIVCDVIQFDAVKGHILVAASVYREHEDTLPAAVDYAFGDAATYPQQMRKFYVEDTCTSAIGRAISLVLETTTKATKQDMAKVERIKNDERSAVIANAPLAVNNTWDEFVSEEPKQPVVTLADAAEMVQQAFGEAEPIPTCSHGERTIKNGVSAAGKAWQGAMCEVRGASKGDRCPPIWYVMSKTTGKFRLPEGVE